MSVRRQNIYRELQDELPVLTAEAVYRTSPHAAEFV